MDDLDAAEASSDSLVGFGWVGDGYKVVAKVGQRYFSVWAGERAEYFMGHESRDEARPHHGGGLYVCRTAASAARHHIAAHAGGLYVAPRVLLRCRCEGPFVEYPNGKVAVSKLLPLEELPMPPGYLHSAPGPQSRLALPRPVSAERADPIFAALRRPLTPSGPRMRQPPGPPRPSSPAGASFGPPRRPPSGAGARRLSLSRRGPGPRGVRGSVSSMRTETEALEEEVRAMERQLGYL